MRTVASSKTPKKISEEDWSRKKEKIKSSKRLSSYSSESEDNSRRKKSRQEPKKLEKKRRKEIKKSQKRKIRKQRYHRDSSVSSMGSDSNLSCSTCHGSSSSSERSRSPANRADRKVRWSHRGRSKGRKRDRERGRRSSRYESRDSRYRSQSCSTCRVGSSSWSSSRSPSPSPSLSKEKFREMGKSRRLKSVLALTKSLDEMEERYGRQCEDRDKIITAYDDFPSCRSNDSFDTGKKRLVEVGNKGNDYCSTPVEDGAYVKGDEVILSKARTQPAKNSDVGGDDSLSCEFGSTKDPSMGREREVVGDDGSKEADDLELILRQKALENFRKFRGGLSAKIGSLNDRKDENVVIMSESKPISSLENQRHIQGGSCPNEFKARSFANPLPQKSIVNFLSEKNNENSMLSHPNDSESSKPVGNRITSSSREGQLKRIQESPTRMSSEKTSLAKDTQSKTVIAEPGSGKALGAKVSTAGWSTSWASCHNTENENDKSNEPMESASGSQFEQKTFSRLHDGEMVQVSYKVYIPKKTPALLRRQLQR